MHARLGLFLRIVRQPQEAQDAGSSDDAWHHRRRSHSDDHARHRGRGASGHRKPDRLAWLEPDRRQFRPPPSVGHQPIPLYLADARAIVERCPAVAEVSPQQETRLGVSFGSNQLASNFVMGVTSCYAHVRTAQLVEGRFVSDHDDLTAAKVAVLGAAVEQYLFPNQDPMGKRILISGIDFEIVGVLSSKGDTPGLGPGMSTDDQIFIPLSALQKRLLGETDLRLIAITAHESRDIPVVVAQVKNLLDARHPGNSFEIKTQLELL
jgi:ABC-type antimicrobial peptide transport system permease subunit